MINVGADQKKSTSGVITQINRKAIEIWGRFSKELLQQSRRERVFK